MTRDDVLKEYAFKEYDGYWGESRTAYNAEDMADEILRLRHELAVIRALRTNTSTFATGYPPTFRMFNYCEVPTDESRSL